MPQFLTDDPAKSTENTYEIHNAIAEAIAKDIRGKVPNSASKRRIAIIGE